MFLKSSPSCIALWWTFAGWLVFFQRWTFYLMHARIPEGEGEGGGGAGRSQNYRFPQEYWSGHPRKHQSYPASIQWWAIIGLLAKCRLFWPSSASHQMAFRWRANDDPLSYMMACLRNIGTASPLTKLSGSPHVALLAVQELEVRSLYHF